MEHEMKLSSSAVRRLRIERGWSQDQLAVASGLSPRTVQRVETAGIASLSTAVCLAATFGTTLIDLQEAPPEASRPVVWTWPSLLLIGLAILTLMAVSESGRPVGLPVSNGMAVINFLVIALNLALIAVALANLLRQRQFVGIGLAALGMPWVTLLAGGAVLALVNGKSLRWTLVGTGVAGFALVVMAFREFRRGNLAARA
jgi:transcriptional regulator with XRE-family HTH domain